MRNECPEWAARIGVEVRHLTKESPFEPDYIAFLLRQIEASELALRSGNEGDDQFDPRRSHM
jgi:hypothetical protein